MTQLYLTFNAGSSSIKFAVFECTTQGEIPLIRGKISGIGGAVRFSAKDHDNAVLDARGLSSLHHTETHESLIALLLPWLTITLGGRRLSGVGHRVVHGGKLYHKPVRICTTVLEQIETLTPLAPLHQSHNIAAIRAVGKWAPELPQIACFDTSFHRTQSRLAQIFALPRALTDEGVLRYGFHGLSYEFIAGALPAQLGAAANGRVIVAHLGNGSSLCAMKDRKSVATTMGFTALDGLMMGRRCGTLDPGVVLYLMQAKGMSGRDIETLLYKKSGLLGVSGLSNDVQILQNSTAAEAREAIELFCYRAASQIAGLVPAIGGLDALVFTAGIGENSALVRKLICDQLAWLGVSLDDKENAENAGTISTAGAPVKTLVVATNEEVVVARGCRSLLS